MADVQETLGDSVDARLTRGGEGEEVAVTSHPGTVQTTDATPTIILDFEVPADDTILGAIVKVVAIEPATGDVMFRFFSVAWKRVSGSTIITTGTATTLNGLHSDGAGNVWTVSAINSGGTTARVRVVGQAAKTIEWSAVAEVLEHTP